MEVYPVGFTPSISDDRQVSPDPDLLVLPPLLYVTKTKTTEGSTHGVTGVDEVGTDVLTGLLGIKEGRPRVSTPH